MAYLDLLLWTKIVSVVFAGLCVIAAEVLDFLDSEKKLHKQGRTIIIGLLILSTLVAVIALVLETNKNKKDADQNAKKLETIVDKSQEQTERLVKLLSDSDSLMKRMRESLKVQQKTLAEATRASESGDDSVQVVYQLTFRTSNAYVKAFVDFVEDEWKAKKQSLIPGQKFDGGEWKDLGGSNFEAQLGQKFGQKFTFPAPAGNFDSQIVLRVPFTIMFFKDKPDIPAPRIGDNFRCQTRYPADQRRASYRFDLEGSSKLDRTWVSSNGEPSDVQTTPYLQYSSADHKLVQKPWSLAVFTTSSRGSAFASALDFSESFMRVAVTDDLVHTLGVGVDITLFRVKIGTHWLRIPMDKVTRDPCGGFVYKLPTDLDSLRARRK
jgi:hypothetical protein